MAAACVGNRYFGMQAKYCEIAVSYAERSTWVLLVLDRYDIIIGLYVCDRCFKQQHAAW